MYEIRIQSTFSAAHNLKNYRGKCELLHGHNWRVEAVFAYDAVGVDGIAVDFRKVKRLLTGITERLDHSYLNRISFLKKLNPTSENIAKYIYDNLRKRNAHVKSVSVWENDTSCATYAEG